LLIKEVFQAQLWGDGRSFATVLETLSRSMSK